MKRSARIRNVNDRDKALKRRHSLRDILSDDLDDETRADTEEQIAQSNKEVDSFDQAFKQTAKRRAAEIEEDVVETVQAALEELGLDLTPEQQKQLQKHIQDTAKPGLQKLRGSKGRFRKRFSSIEDVQEAIEEKTTELEQARRDYEELPTYESNLTPEDIEGLEDELYELELALGKHQREAQRALTEMRDNAAEIIEDIKSIAEVHADEDESDEEDDEVLDMTKESYKLGLKAFKQTISVHIPNDSSVEKQLTEAVKNFLEAEKSIKVLANTFSRNRSKQVSLLAFSSLVSMPGRALMLAMAANDDQPKTAGPLTLSEDDSREGPQPASGSKGGWRDRLKKLIPRGSNQAKEIVNAEKDAKKFVKFMRSLEPSYAKAFDNLPTQGKAKTVLTKAISSYEEGLKDLKKASAGAAAEYPVVPIVIEAVVESGARTVKFLKKAL